MRLLLIAAALFSPHTWTVVRGGGGMLLQERNTSVRFEGDASPPLYSTLRYYYVMRWRREEEEVHFLATHDKQITFERLIPRHYSPSSTLSFP